MTRGELGVVTNLKGYKVLETWLFGKPYAWIFDPQGGWELEPIEE